MTDNRTTELLCKLLDERGVNYMVNDVEARVWLESDGDYLTTLIEEQPDGSGRLCVKMKDLTPEQAIAATLGSEPDGFCAWGERA